MQRTANKPQIPIKGVKKVTNRILNAKKLFKEKNIKL